MDAPHWQQQQDEPENAYQAFLSFCEMEPARRAVLAHPASRKVTKQWREWIVRFRWVERADARDRGVPALPFERPFLGRPLGQEKNPSCWDAWTPFMLWLLELDRERYLAICDAEDALGKLEREGTTEGPAWEAGRDDLRTKFEEARRWSLGWRTKVTTMMPVL